MVQWQGTHLRDCGSILYEDPTSLFKEFLNFDEEVIANRSEGSLFSMHSPEEHPTVRFLILHAVVATITYIHFILEIHLMVEVK